MTIIPQFKTCKTCNKRKSSKDFYKLKRSKDGLDYECKACHLARKRRNAGNVKRDKKVCCVCKVEKEIGKFCKSRSAPDGRSNQCKTCAIKYMKDYRKTEKGIEVDRRAAMKYHYTERGQEVYKKAQIRYKSTKIGKRRLQAGWTRRRAREAGADGSFTQKEWNRLCKKYDNRCVACGKKTKLEVDHIVPLSKGGSSYISNIQPLCRSCNASKSDKTIDYR